MDPKLPEDLQPVAEPLAHDPSQQETNSPEPSAGTNDVLNAQPIESFRAEEIGLNPAGEPDAGWEEFSEEAIEDSEIAEAPPTETTDESPAEAVRESPGDNSPSNKEGNDIEWAERLLDALEAEVKARDSAAKPSEQGQAEEYATPTEIVHGPIGDPGTQPPLRQPSGTIELPLPAEDPSSADTSSGNNTQASGDENIGYGTVTVVTNQEGSEIGHPLPRIYVAVELLNARQLYEQARHDTAQLLQTTLVNIADDRINFWFWKRSSSERASDRFGR